MLKHLSHAVAFVLLPLSAAAMARQDGVCFRHIGLQEKPMPEFCVANEPLRSDERETIIVAGATVARILSRCIRSPDVGAAHGPGVYEWTASGKSRQGVIGPAEMLEITKVIRKDAAERGVSLPHLIERLSLRLHE